MIPLTLTEIATATGGEVINANQSSITIKSVSTDSRKIDSDCLFIALQGEKFDAHQFIKQVENSGAVSLLVHQKVETNLPYVLVDDTRIGLGQLGAFVKQQIKDLKCAAITGSNGKTTTKELLSHILRYQTQVKNGVLSTAGNFNNDIGLPLTLLRLTHENKFAVVELGANHIGEIDYTSRLAQPDVALINNVMPAHLEGFGSIEGVAKAKGEIWRNIKSGGTAVVNLDSDFATQFLHELKQLNVNILTFSQQPSEQANIYPTDIRFDSLGKAIFTLNLSDQQSHQTADIHLNLPGKHNISNALAAASMAISLGCGLAIIKAGLDSVEPVAGRVNCEHINDLLTVIDDTYNANSASVKAAIDLLAQYTGSRLLILGDMAELGLHSEQEHQAIGKYAALQGIERLLTVGELTKQTSLAFKQENSGESLHFATKVQLIDHLQNTLLQNNKIVTILVKGSRGAKMEEIVAYIKQLQL
ncbi:UDP-N-acetylmuramoyl-tripeptide--D-alanyl-D-alanine ligase [Psychromonas sp. PT13]|uniref:UDP-N-acetylmuramoyl-tripeptide--D-alanyl-D- alanine ligase n=1 Tax=Psychromonas sp. PT13 TaxID=3439547 RepID=UPI003EBEDAA8